MSFLTNTDRIPNTHSITVNSARGVSELRRFFAVGTVSNSPHSYSIQSSLFSSNFKSRMVLHKKMKKMTWPKSTLGSKTWSHEFAGQTRPNANTTSGHIPGPQPWSGERFGPVVIEIEAKRPSVPLLIISTPPDGMGRPKINFCNTYPNTVKL